MLRLYGYHRVVPTQSCGVLRWLQAALLSLLAPVLVLALATQLSLGLTGYHRQDECNDDRNLDILPNSTRYFSTGPTRV